MANWWDSDPVAQTPQQKWWSNDPVADQKPETRWSDVPGEMVRNAPASAAKFGGAMLDAAAHPLRTGDQLGALMSGGLGHAWNAVMPDSMDMTPGPDMKMASAVAEAYKDRYWGADNVKNTLAHDPVGVAADLSTVLTGAAGALAKAGLPMKALEISADATNPLSVARAVPYGLNKMKALTAAPQDKVAAAILGAAEKAGVDGNTLSALGDHGTVLDALGEKGSAMARRAANISPDARQMLTDALLGRKAGQNERIVAALEDASGLPRGNTASVDALKANAYRAAAPAINKAYSEARTAGYDLPREPFRTVLESPMGNEAYLQAETALKNRVASEGIDASSELARLDQTKRLLDAKANMAFRAGDNETGAQAAALAKTLREAMDQSIAGPEYAGARALRRQAYQTENAYAAGEQLASGRVPLGAPESAVKLQGEFGQPLAQGYAAAQAENLLNKGATAGAYAKMSTPQGKAAYNAALGDKAGLVDESLRRERIFNRSAQDSLGNSTTARQLAEMGNPELASEALKLAASVKSGGISALAEAAVKHVTGAFVTKAQRDAAPKIIEALLKNELPVAPGFMTGSKSIRDKLIKALMGYQAGAVTGAADQ